MDIAKYLKERKAVVDDALDRVLPSASRRPPQIHKAMRYSVQIGGKRIRPILCLAACDAVGGTRAKAMDTACALELIHTYSLIHDDLPCMDDDDLRRGRPTCHKVFDEATAVLAGDALLTFAFEILAQNTARVSEKTALRVARAIAIAAGSNRLIGGQMEDILGEGKKVSLSQLRFIHQNKTAALIEASVLTGALTGGASRAQLASLSVYGKSIGLSFQVADDILDVTGNEKMMGKRVHKDAGMKKATYPGLLGLEKSRRYLERLTQSALASLRSFGPSADPLREIALFIARRDH